MKKYFDNVKVDWEELERQKKEMEELIEIGKKNKQAYMNFLGDFHKRLDKLVDEQLAN